MVERLGCVMKKQNGLTKKVLFSLLAAGMMSGFAAGGVSAANVIGTVKVGGEEISVDTPTGTATVGEAGKTLSIENSKDDAVGLFGKNDNLTLNGSEITITSTAKSGVGIDVGSSKQTESPYATVTVGDDKTDKISVNTSYTGIQAIRGHLTLTADEVDVTSTGDFAVWLQNNTETEKAPDGASSIDITADTVNLKGAAGGVVVFSNGQLNITGDTTIDGGTGAALDVRGNSTTNINTDGKHTTVIKGNIVFETPNTQTDAQNSGKLVNANVNLNLSGEGSSWTGSAYQEFKDVPHGTAISGNGSYYGDVKGLSVALNDGAKWNMTEDSFVNTAEVKDGASINVTEEVKTFNGDKVDLDGGALNSNGGTTTINTFTAGNGASVSLNNTDLVVNGGKSEIVNFKATGTSNLTLTGDTDMDIQGGKSELSSIETKGTASLGIGGAAEVNADTVTTIGSSSVTVESGGTLNADSVNVQGKSSFTAESGSTVISTTG